MPKPSQPPLSLPLKAPDLVLMTMCAVVLLGTWVYAVHGYYSLPETIPAHFTLKGEVDRYDNKLFLLLFPIFSTFSAPPLLWLATKPHLFNFPVRITPENMERQYRLACRMIRVICLTLLLIFALIEVMMISSARHPEQGPQLWIIPLILVITFIPLVVYLVLASKHK